MRFSALRVNRIVPCPTHWESTRRHDSTSQTCTTRGFDRQFLINPFCAADQQLASVGRKGQVGDVPWGKTDGLPSDGPQQRDEQQDENGARERREPSSQHDVPPPAGNTDAPTPVHSTAERRRPSIASRKAIRLMLSLFIWWVKRVWTRVPDPPTTSQKRFIRLKRMVSLGHKWRRRRVGQGRPFIFTLPPGRRDWHRRWAPPDNARVTCPCRR
jgi:hypothetical protein